ncbi:MAG: GTP-binding protein [Blastocatellia bacterium]|nr:GTP-binding protein [Blastocatellia bacterium]
MIQKKVCMVGSSAVGKTSLVSRFVESIFSDKYLTTVGVKIDKKIVRLQYPDREEGEEVMLMLWDLAGEDEFLQLRMSYLRGTAGYLLVADGTRRVTIEKAFDLKKRVEGELGRIPFVLALNKHDLEDEWDVSETEVEGFSQIGWPVVKTSAKTGEGVEELFSNLVGRMMRDE